MVVVYWFGKISGIYTLLDIEEKKV